MIKNFFSFIFELIKIVVISLVIIIPIRYFLIQPFYVKGASMEPNFYDHEYLIVDEISYRFNQVHRGDIVVFRYPLDPQEYFIKRVIGLPGEKVQIKDGKVFIYNAANPNGIALDEPYLKPGEVTLLASSKEPQEIASDEIFVLGDNRNASKDSRFFGPVRKSFVTGKVLLRGWPFTRLDYFEQQSYTF